LRESIGLPACFERAGRPGHDAIDAAANLPFDKLFSPIRPDPNDTEYPDPAHSAGQSIAISRCQWGRKIHLITLLAGLYED